MSNMIRLDDLENGYFIYQDTDAFCFGIDAVLLAHYPALREGDKVCDLCSGNGIIPLLIDSTAKKTGRNVRITGLEL
ncbi:MAG: SAM-dependent methyltransferase, partial [Lachnospiraceae bacterium]|nr:SAM-dependent methyltransferase [Lachnospiraceae bacterium]